MNVSRESRYPRSVLVSQTKDVVELFDRKQEILRCFNGNLLELMKRLKNCCVITFLIGDPFTSNANSNYSCPCPMRKSEIKYVNCVCTEWPHFYGTYAETDKE